MAMTGEQFKDLLKSADISIRRAFDAAMKCASKNNHSRPVLEGVHYNDSGVLVATDSMKLIRIENAWVKGTEPFTVTYQKKVHHIIKGNYPQTDKLIPDTDNAKATIALDVHDTILRNVLKMTCELYNKEKYPSLLIQYVNDEISIKPVITERIATGLTLNYKPKMVMATGEDFSIAMNAKFLLDILDSFKKMQIPYIKLHFYEKLKPMLFTAVDYDPHNIHALLLPIRLYGENQND